MNWDALGAFAELIAAIGVIVTLGYLAIQIRNSAMVDRANIRANLTQGSMNVISHAKQDAEIFIKTNNGETLTDVERMRLTMFHRMAFRNYENYAYQHKLGLFEESEWQGFYEVVAALFEERFAQEDWRALRHQFSPTFQSMIDPMVPELGDVSMRPSHMYAGNRGGEGPPSKT